MIRSRLTFASFLDSTNFLHFNFRPRRVTPIQWALSFSRRASPTAGRNSTAGQVLTLYPQRAREREREGLTVGWGGCGTVSIWSPEACRTCSSHVGLLGSLGNWTYWHYECMHMHSTYKQLECWQGNGQDRHAKHPLPPHTFTYFHVPGICVYPGAAALTKAPLVRAAARPLPLATWAATAEAAAAARAPLVYPDTETAEYY